MKTMFFLTARPPHHAQFDAQIYEVDVPPDAPDPVDLMSLCHHPEHHAACRITALNFNDWRDGNSEPSGAEFYWRWKAEDGGRRPGSEPIASTLVWSGPEVDIPAKYKETP